MRAKSKNISKAKVNQSWWARLDSNQRPIGYEPTALPLSYEPVSSTNMFEVCP